MEHEDMRRKLSAYLDNAVTAEEKTEHVHRYERSYGVFERSFTVPSTVDADHIQASYDLGVLTVRLPKVEKAKPRQIAVKVEPAA